MAKQKELKKHGDTLIEVTLCIAIFSLVAVLSLNLMNNGVSNAQRTLEITMARNEIDAQAEALRYIHSSYVAERQLSQSQSQFRKLWDAIRDIANTSNELENSSFDSVQFDINTLDSCSEAYGIDGGYARVGSAVYSLNSFVLNTRLLLPDSDTSYAGDSYDTVMKDIVVGMIRVEGETEQQPNKLWSPSLYPRIVYESKGSLADSDSRGISAENANSNIDGSLVESKIYDRISRAEGIWIVAAGEGTASNITKSSYYDFYIRTCWHSVGERAPSTITTIVRLYNPEVIE